MTPTRHGALFALPALALTLALGPAPARGQATDDGPSDAVIAHIAVTANAIDVATGKLALERGSSDQVKAFAKTMVDDHTSVNTRAAALAKKLGLTPEDNATSKSLQAGADEAREKLEGLSGAAFDAAYMDREIGYHQAVLDALDQTLIPNADNAELKSLLEDARAAVAAHLARAKSIRDGLEEGGGV